MAGFPEVLFVHQGTVAEGEEFLGRLWPEARAVSDPDRKLFSLFDLGRASWGQLLGARVWGAGLRAALKGHGVGRPVGNPLIQGGAFLVEDGEIRRRHAYAHSGDHPDWAAFAGV